MKAFCRDCFWQGGQAVRRCPVCASPRIVAHDELGGLSIAQIRLRKGQQTTTGQELFVWNIERDTNFASVTSAHFCYIKNASGADISTALSLTVQKFAGVPALSLAGEIIMTIEDVGSTSNNPLYQAIAADIT